MKEEELDFISVQQDDEENMSMNSQLYAKGQTNSDSGYWIIFTQSKHPYAALFHLLFKVSALFFYIFGSWFSSSFIFSFVLCIVLLAFDFWTVKNVSGRLLVGLRWWSYVREDGSNEWVFESLEDMAEISLLDSNLFWITLYSTPVIWALLFIIGFLRLKFEYLPVVMAAIVMSMANIIGYMKCSSNAKGKIKSIVEQGMKSSSMAALENDTFRNWILTSLLAVTASKKAGNDINA